MVDSREAFDGGSDGEELDYLNSLPPQSLVFRFFTSGKDSEFICDNRVDRESLPVSPEEIRRGIDKMQINGQDYVFGGERKVGRLRIFVYNLESSFW